jgi:hypothetical protein
MTVTGDYAYSGDRKNSIYAINVVDPQRPVHISTVTVEGSVESILAQSGHLFVLTSSSIKPNSADGVGIYFLPSPVLPLPIAFLNLSARPYRAALSEDYLYVATGLAGLEVIDVSDPASPLRIGSVPSGDASTGTVVVGGAVFVADGTGGLFELPAQGCVPSP